MIKIEIISASAGSGKTHKLTELLKEEIGRGRVRPGAIVATTFTKKAAAELQERVRTGLLEAGRVDDAQVLATSRIGTVNSICGRLVASFSFGLGLPASLRVLDEEPAGLALKRTLSRVITADEVDELAELESRWSDLKWLQHTEELVRLARSNAISAAQLAACAERSKAEYLALLGAPAVDFGDLKRGLEQAVADLAAAARALKKPDKKNIEAAKLAEAFMGRLRAGQAPAWSDWRAIAEIDAGKNLNQAGERLRTVARQHDCLPLMARDAGRIIDLIFGIAARSLDVYQNYKTDLGLIDFVDQEVLALKLLNRQDVQERLRDEIDLVLVDEFQDTSPLQLAVFLALAKVAKRSVWVGDQKQAIFGFRGTDPRLMDDVIEAILEGQAPETLAKSYRSRPELVRLTSDVFQDVFADQKIPRQRVRLEPAEEDEPEGLGPIVERWVLPKGSKPVQARAIAAGVKELLSGSTTRVRVTGRAQTRAVKPGDIAVLCRSNNSCEQVASALESIGVRAAIPRKGLLGKAEARLLMAGMKLWFDKDNSVAAAELLRLTRYADAPNDWLEQIIATAEKGAAVADPLLEKIGAARQAAALAGPLQVFDTLLRVIDARELCLGWGNAQARLANLDALRQHVVAYVSGSSEQGAESTLAGLLAWLERLAASAADDQATLTDDSAVRVSTWHNAKGLEWPIVVIHSLDSKPQDSALGVKMIAPDEKFDLEDPLAGRWIRYWPFPYSKNTKNSGINRRLQVHQASQRIRAQEDRERLRLLYVCWTRARDRLILPAKQGALAEGILSLLRAGEAQLIVDTESPGPNAQLSWAGRRVELRVRELVPEEEKERAPEPGHDYVPQGPHDYPPAWVNPSGIAGRGSSGEPETIGDRLQLAGGPDKKNLGDAVHGFMAADIEGLEQSQRQATAAGLLERWGVKGSLAPADLLLAGDRLKAWVKQRWPAAKWHREIPMTYKNQAGSTVRGICDLALETQDGWVVIDHKTYSDDDPAEHVAGYAPQLKAYADGITAATGKKVLGTWIHLPILGLAVPVECEGAAG